jgi:Xaa-Pro aminopeptidase
MNEKGSVIPNIGRLNAVMDREGFDALVLRSGVNFTYLSGVVYPGTLARHLDLADSPRGVVLVWPRSGQPTLVLNSFAAPLARRDSSIGQIVQYDDYGESVYAKTAEVLAGMGLKKGRIGFEKNSLSALRWEEVLGLLSQANIRDCSALMDEVRRVKTDREVAILEEAADLLDEAYLEVFSGVKAGDTEREVHGRLLESCIRKGAGWAHGILNSSRNSVIYGGEGDTVFQEGDIIRNDYVAYHRGYPGHQSRTVVVGEPSAEQKATYRLVRDAYRATIEQCRPGVQAQEIHRFASESFRKAGFPDPLALAGHSVGPWWHQQPPFLVPGSSVELEAGMVLALEPHVRFWHLQDMVLVTDEGPRLLSARFSTDEMLVVG